MKVDYQIVQKRRDDIMMIIQKLGDVTVKQLMNDFNVDVYKRQPHYLPCSRHHIQLIG